MPNENKQTLNILLDQSSNEDIFELLSDNSFKLAKELFGEEEYRTKFMDLKMEKDLKKVLKEELKKY